MTVGIAGGDAGNPAHLQIIDDYFEKLIEDSGCYLFTVFVAGIKDYERTDPPLALQYSTLRGVPYKYKEYTSLDRLIQGICKEVDYLIILNDKTQIIKRLFMSYKQTGKHGSMIEL